MLQAGEDVDDGGDVGSRHGPAVACDVGAAAVLLGVLKACEHVHHASDVGGAHFAISIHVAPFNPLGQVRHDVGEFFPHVSRLVRAQILGQHVERFVLWHVIKDIDAHNHLLWVGVSLNPRQAAATIERRAADGRDGVADGHARQATATIERHVADGRDGVADGRDGVADGHARQASAILKRSEVDGCDGVGDGHARQACATVERPLADGRDGVGDGHTRQAAAILEFASCFISTTCVLNGRKVMTQIL